MSSPATCEIDTCREVAVQNCSHCGRALCTEHVVADYSHLPGGQRPYCASCDAERRLLYQSMRTRGLRAIVWCGGGAVAGAALGYAGSALATTDSFTHTVSTDVGFIAGLAVALYLVLAAIPARRP